MVGADGAEALGLAGLHGEGAEVHAAALLVLVAHRGEGLLDDVVRADADAAGGDQQVGADELVLDGGAEGLGVVGDRAHPVADGSGVAGGGAQGEAVGVVDLAGVQRLARLHQFAAGGEHDHPRAGAYPDGAAADRGQQAELRRAEDRARAKGEVARADVAALGPYVGAGLRRAVHPYLAGGALGGGAVGAHPGDRALAESPVGPLDRDDGLGAGRQRGAGHDAGGLPGAHVRKIRAARRDVADDGEDRRILLAGARDVRDPYRVPVHRAVVERRQGDRHRDVLDQDAALGVEELQLDGFEGADGGEDVLQVVVHRPEAVLAGRAGGGAAQDPCISSAT